MKNITEQIIPFIIQYGIKILSALVVLVVGWWLVKKTIKLLKKILVKQSLDAGLQSFIVSFSSIALKVLLIIVVLGQLGVATTSFVAILGAAGLAVGLALQGSLSNFAGGVLILFFKPFQVNDTIEAQGFIGKVTHIQIFVTTILTPENKTVIIPNGDLSNGSIINYSKQGILRVDLVVGISYDADIRNAKKIAHQVLRNNKNILDTPEPIVSVLELADSSVNLAIRPWVNTADYWNVYFDILEEIKYAFDNNNIGIPYPQQVVHLHNKNDAS